MGRALYVVLTNGSKRDETGRLQPSAIAKKRWCIAITDLLERYHGDADIAFCGGERELADQSEAVVLAQWAIWQPEMRGQHSMGVFTIAESKYTAGDMVALADWMRSNPGYNMIYLVTHCDHAKLARETLLDCDLGSISILQVDSGEPDPYSPRVLKLLEWVYRHDPRWTRWQSWPFRVLANCRGRNE